MEMNTSVCSGTNALNLLLIPRTSFGSRLNAFEKTMRACDVKFRDLALKAREEVRLRVCMHALMNCC